MQKLFKANSFLTDVYYENLDTNDHSYLSKHTLERLHIHFPSGPRYKMFAYEMPTDFMTHENEPTGRTYTDMMKGKYLQKLQGGTNAITVTAANPPKLR